MPAPRSAPTVPSFAPGPLASATLNQLGTAVTDLLNPPSFSMYQGLSQNVADNAFTQITCDTQDWDSDNGRGAGTPYSYTVPTGWGGRWRVSANTAWSSNATGIRGCAIYVNGAQYNGAYWAIPAGPATAVTSIGGTRTLILHAGDVIALYGYQHSTITLATQAGGALCSFLEGEFRSFGTP